MNLLNKALWGPLLEKVALTVSEGTGGGNATGNVGVENQPVTAPAGIVGKSNPLYSGTAAAAGLSAAQLGQQGQTGQVLRPRAATGTTQGRALYSGDQLKELKALQGQFDMSTADGQNQYAQAWASKQKAWGLESNPKKFGAMMVQSSPKLQERMAKTDGGMDYMKGNPFLGGGQGVKSIGGLPGVQKAIKAGVGAAVKGMQSDAPVAGQPGQPKPPRTAGSSPGKLVTRPGQPGQPPAAGQPAATAGVKPPPPKAVGLAQKKMPSLLGQAGKPAPKITPPPVERAATGFQPPAQPGPGQAMAAAANKLKKQVKPIVKPPSLNRPQMAAGGATGGKPKLPSVTSGGQA